MVKMGAMLPQGRIFRDWLLEEPRVWDAPDQRELVQDWVRQKFEEWQQSPRPGPPPPNRRLDSSKDKIRADIMAGADGNVQDMGGGLWGHY